MQIVAWMAAAFAYFDPAPVAPNPRLRPVVLVHGIHSDAGCMLRLAKHLRAEGRLVFTPSLARCNGAAPIEDLAGQLAAFTTAHLPRGTFDLVGFSMGGLVSRYYVQRLGGTTRVANFVTLAAPHRGTKLAWLHPGEGGRQMRPRSAFLRDLDRDAHVLRAVKFTSFYTPLDTVVVPPQNSTMPQAKNVVIWAATHPGFVLEKRCLRAVAQALRE